MDLSYGEEEKAATEDHVQAYASEVLTLGLQLMEFMTRSVKAMDSESFGAGGTSSCSSK